jgi:hypothetical protein
MHSDHLLNPGPQQWIMHARQSISFAIQHLLEQQRKQLSTHHMVPADLLVSYIGVQGLDAGNVKQMPSQGWDWSCELASSTRIRHEADAIAHRLDGAADVFEDGKGALVAPHQPQANQRRLQCKGHDERYPMALSGQALQQSKTGLIHIAVLVQLTTGPPVPLAACSIWTRGCRKLGGQWTCSRRPTHNRLEQDSRKVHLDSVAVGVPNRGQGAAAHMHSGVHA